MQHSASRTERSVSAGHKHSPQHQLRQRLEQIIQLIPQQDLQQFAALDDLSMLGELETHYAARLASNSAVGRALSRGQRERSRLMRTTDMLTTDKAAKLLGIKEDSVRKRIAREQLLAIKQNHFLLLPAFQFIDGTAVNGLAACLQALRNFNRWSVLDWFMLPHPDLDQKTPAESLHKQTAAVILAAQRFGVQGGS